MCSSDVNSIVWQWFDGEKATLPTGALVHTCRDYSKIQEWGKQHKFDFDSWDETVYIEDDL